MTVDLAVETDLIRQAADVLDEAASSFDPSCEQAWDCPLTDESLGSSAVAREVAGAAARRVLQACEVARSLAGLSTDAASRLRAASDAFDAAEAAAIAGPR